MINFLLLPEKYVFKNLFHNAKNQTFGHYSSFLYLTYALEEKEVMQTYKLIIM